MKPFPTRLTATTGILAGACLASAQPYFELPLPSVSGFGTTSPKALSEMDPDNLDGAGNPGYCYLAGSCSVYPAIFQRGVQSSAAGAWTTVPVVDDLGNSTGALGFYFPSVNATTPQLPPLFAKGVNYSAGYAAATGVALTGVKAAPSVRVGYTPLYYTKPAAPINALRFHATSWVANGAGGYTANDLDAGNDYASSRAYAVVQGDDGTDLACGDGFTTVANNLVNLETPVFWSLNANGTPATGPTELPKLNGDAFPYAVDARTDGGATVTFVGEGGGTIPAQAGVTRPMTAKWALFWREPFPGDAIDAPLNLNDPSVTSFVPTPGNAAGNCVAGTAYAVASYDLAGACGPGVMDVVVGQVTIKASYTVRGRTYPTTVRKAYMWFSTDGMAWEGHFVIPADAAAPAGSPTLLNSVARGVSIVGGVPKIVGAVQTASGWSGFIADPPGACDLTSWTTENFQLDVNSTPAGRWTVADIMAINSDGVMVATERLSGSWTFRSVLLVPNPENFNVFDFRSLGDNPVPPNL